MIGNITYTYVVSAINGAGQSSPSMPVDATPLMPPTLAAQIQTGSGQLTLSWPAWAADYLLYEAASLTPPIQWSVLTNAPQTNEGKFYITLPTSSSEKYFYQLKGLLSGASQ